MLRTIWNYDEQIHLVFNCCQRILAAAYTINGLKENVKNIGDSKVQLNTLLILFENEFNQSHYSM